MCGEGFESGIIRIVACVLATALLLGCSPIGDARAAQLTAQPTTLSQTLQSAGAGDTVALSPGDYGVLTLRDRSWSAPVTIEAGSAHFAGMLFVNVDGLNINGGDVVSDGAINSHAVLVRFSHHISLNGVRISHARTAVTLDRSENISLRGLDVSDMLDDGVDIAMSHHVLIDHLVCRDWSPIAREFDASGNLIKDAPHPDCVQAWSRPNIPPVSDISVTNSSATGKMQGISFFNHIRNGVDDGGFDRVSITGNTVQISAPNGISLNSGRNSVIRDNEVRSIAGSTLERNGRPVRTKIVNINGRDNVVCGNRIPDRPSSPEALPCPH